MIKYQQQLSGVYAAFDIGIRSLDHRLQSVWIDVGIGLEFHMTHALARTFEQAIGIGDLGAAEEADINVGCEGIDVTERRFTHAGGRMVVVQQLPNIVAAAAHDLKPSPGHRSEFTRTIIKPRLNRRIASNGSWKLKESVHDLSVHCR